jgi:hypothetical protein
VEQFTNGTIRKPIAIPGTYARLEQAPKGLGDVAVSMVKGTIEGADIIVFILVLGGLIGVINKTGAFTRASSVFNNSEFAAQGTPSAGELKLLEPFRAELPPRVFGPAFKPPTTANNPKALRQNLLKARALLAEAGCTLGNNGKLRLPSGEPLEIEYMVPLSTNIVDWQRNLDKRIEFAALSSVFARELTQPERPLHSGTIMGLKSDRLYVRLDDMALDVKLYREDLERQFGIPYAVDNVTAQAMGENAASWTMGQGVRLRIRDYESTRHRFLFDLEPLGPDSDEYFGTAMEDQM